MVRDRTKEIRKSPITGTRNGAWVLFNMICPEVSFIRCRTGSKRLDLVNGRLCAFEMIK